MKYYQIFLGCLAAAAAQQQQYTTPIPILKQINRHNEDGSYSYGYEAADGTYKIESKYPNGEVFGKYGYVDDNGKLREIEYGASRRGFEPQGNEVNVAPPTLNDKYPPPPLSAGQEDDGQYREDPAVYYKDEKYNQNPPSNAPVSRFAFNSQQPSYQQNYQQPAFRPTSKFSFDDFIQNKPQPQPQYQPQPQPQYQPQAQAQYQPQYQAQYQQYQPQQYQPPAPAYQPTYYNPYPQNYGGSSFSGNPAANVDLVHGSYTVNYKRR